ncbi:hypothetical protein [Streptomyces minutiscleroticus]|nr:hypothetical protein [Streptomyces minutiscleroticus]
MRVGDEARARRLIGRAQQRWPTLARRAAARGHDLQQVFALARAVVVWWWRQAPHWPDEQIWPARTAALTHAHHRRGGAGEPGGPGEGWHALVRDAVVLPELVTVAAALTDPACEQLVRADHGRTRPAALGAGGRFVHHLAHRLHRPWLGPLLGVDYTSPLQTWVAMVLDPRRRAAARVRRGEEHRQRPDGGIPAGSAAPPGPDRLA